MKDCSISTREYMTKDVFTIQIVVLIYQVFIKHSIIKKMILYIMEKPQDQQMSEAKNMRKIWSTSD